MALTTTTRVETYLGIDLDSTQETEMDLIITAVQEMLESYTNRKFDQATFYEQKLGTGDREFVLANTPIDEIKWLAMGMDSLMSVTYGGTKAASIEVEDQELRLSKNLATTRIDLTDSTITDIDDVVTAVNALTDWTASAYDDYGSYPALILNPIVKCPVDDDTNYQIDLSGCATWMKAYREREGLYVSNRPIPEGMPYTCIYVGGYETIPASLAQLATEMAAAIWRLYVQHGGGILKSERIGDYSYSLSDIVGDAGSTSLIQMFRSRIDQYARIEI